MNLLYRKTPPHRLVGPVHYSQVRTGLPLGGQRGPLSAVLSSAAPGEAWTIEESGMLSAVLSHHRDLEGWQDPQAFSFVIDLKPTADHLNLYELKRAWGMVTQDRRGKFWSPIALQLQTLFRDGESLSQVNVAGEKSEFDRHETHEDVLEFLYQVRTDKGVWAWGPPGSVNACLLFPEHMRVLWKRIGEEFGHS